MTDSDYTKKIRNYILGNRLKIKSKFEQYLDNLDNRSLPNKNEYYNYDFPISINEQYENSYLEIFNYSYFFRIDEGFFTLINDCSLLFTKFSEKNKNLSEQQKTEKIKDFFDSLIESDRNKLEHLLGYNVSEEYLRRIKKGVDKLTLYFGYKNIKNYLFNKTLFALEGLSITFSLIMGALTISGPPIIFGTLTGLGIVVAIGIIAYYSYKNYSIKRDKEKIIEENKEIIESFFKTNSYLPRIVDLENNNLLVISIEKKKEIISNFTFFEIDLGEINPNICPKYKKDEHNNMEIYYYLLKAIKECVEELDKIEDKKKFLVSLNKNIEDLAKQKNLNDLKKFIIARKEVKTNPKNSENSHKIETQINPFSGSTNWYSEENSNSEEKIRVEKTKVKKKKENNQIA